MQFLDGVFINVKLLQGMHWCICLLALLGSAIACAPSGPQSTAYDCPGKEEHGSRVSVSDPSQYHRPSASAWCDPGGSVRLAHLAFVIKYSGLGEGPGIPRRRAFGQDEVANPRDRFRDFYHCSPLVLILAPGRNLDKQVYPLSGPSFRIPIRVSIRRVAGSGH